MKQILASLCYLRTYVSAALVGLATDVAVGQDLGEDEVFELSPFMVSAEDSTGYQARSTLAGTRIKTNLKDLGAAISVVTEEFLDDTGSTGIEDFLQYTGSTEIGGPEGNYSGAIDSGSTYFTDIEERANPSQTARVRGIGEPNFTRNYFSTDIPIDRYNTSGITISRGANSLLFGLGSAAGVIENGVKFPTVGVNRNRYDIRFDGHGTTRGSFNIDRTVIEDRLAIKVSGLYDDTQYAQDPASELERRAYLAFNAVLLKNENSDFFGKTVLRGNFEAGEIDRIPPAYRPPTMGYESFFRPPFDFEPYNGIDYDPITGGHAQLTSTWRKWGLLDTRFHVTEDGRVIPGYKENAAAEGFMDLYSTPFFWANSTTMVIQPDGTRSVGHAGDIAHIQGFSTRPKAVPTDAFHIDGTPLSAEPNGHQLSRAYMESGHGLGFRAESVINRDVFDYRNKLLIGDMNSVFTEFDAQTVFLEQSLFGGKGGVEIALDKQRFDQDRFQPFESRRREQTSIDTTEYLVDGSRNPNAGRVVMTPWERMDEVDQNFLTERESRRVTAFVEHDFRDQNESLGNWLGRHTITGLFQTEEKFERHTKTGWYTDGLNFMVRDGGDPTHWARDFSPLFVISDDNTGKEEHEVRLQQLSRSMMPNPGDIWTAHYIVDDTDINSVEERQFIIAERVKDVSVSGLEVDSDAFAWQSYFLDGHIVGLYGRRSDTVSNYSRGRVDPETGQPILNADGTLDTSGPIRDNSGGRDPRSIAAIDRVTDPSETTTTWSVVAHAPQKWIENMPVSSLSIHYASADNFQAGESGTDHNLEFVQAPTGKTTEYGISFGFVEDKWSLRINRFETTAKNVAVDSRPVSDAIAVVRDPMNAWQRYKAAGHPYTIESGNANVIRNINLGFETVDELIQAYEDAWPERMSSALNFQLNDTGSEFEQKGVISPPFKAVGDINAEGYELELVGNPTNNWRIAANLSKVEATPSNSAQAIWDLALEVQQRYEASGVGQTMVSDDTILTLDERWKQRLLTPVANIRANDGVPSSELRKWRFNAITNYSFSEGRFAGFGVGGALRYQSAVSTGSGLRFEDGLVLQDLNNMFEGPSETTVDGWVSYRTRLKDNIDWKIQLNIRNIFGDEDPIPIFTNPDGRDVVYRIAPEAMNWSLSSTFMF